MKQKFLRIKTDDVSFDVPMPDNTIMPALAEHLQTKGFLIFDKLLVTRDTIKYLCLYEMDAENKQAEERPQIDLSTIGIPEGFKPS